MRRRSAPRGGKTLIEMLVVMTAMTAILTVTGRLLHQLSRAEWSVRDATAVGRAELRLARDFRRDVRAASSAEPIGGSGRTGLRLLTHAGAIEYDHREDAVRRSSPGRREAYRLGPIDATFSVDGDGWATLEITPGEQPAGRRRFAAGPSRVLARIGPDAGGPGGPPPRREPPLEAPKPEGGSP